MFPLDVPASGYPGRRPVIGIAASREVVQFSWWTLECDFMTSAYTEAIQLAGGRVVLLPIDARDIDAPDEALHGLDALLLPGGNDVDPAQYGHEPHHALGPVIPVLDDVQLALTRAALAADLPVLGVCRGMQVLNVATGGTLHQHLPELLEGSEEHRKVPGTLGTENEHDVAIDAGSLAAEAIGGEVAVTRSHHHQAVDAIGEGFIVSGRSSVDGLVEAIEAPGAGFCLGVQWHPEADPESTVIAALVEAARRRITQAELSA
ncbi:MAG: gamma-glutamyl-gamma-aminobutyrate hydrolase family protein [Solirubrobacteraceae bacterium]|nr:gamma-glutamyl-gamma-aminobutyrate hydrolase family protein [Solirubrobacteraceae bacterium]